MPHDVRQEVPGGERRIGPDPDPRPVGDPGGLEGHPVGGGDVPDVRDLPRLVQEVPAPEHVAHPVDVDRVVEDRPGRRCRRERAQNDAGAHRHPHQRRRRMLPPLRVVLSSVVVVAGPAELVQHRLAVVLGPSVGVFEDPGVAETLVVVIVVVVGCGAHRDRRTGGARAGVHDPADRVGVLADGFQDPFHRDHVAVVHGVIVRIPRR